MSEYNKIQTIFKRDEKNLIKIGDFTLEEFDILKNIKWECTEKIDGTNMRFEIDRKLVSDGNYNVTINIGGKTAAAQIPPKLKAKMDEYANVIKDLFNEVFAIKEGETDLHVTLYGEGYGKSIQKVGGQYIKDTVDFILFDVKIGNWWLARKDVEDIGSKLGLEVVPLVGYFTIPEACMKVANGFKSFISEDENLIAEGLVLRAPCGLCRRDGSRLITKIKYKDFNELETKGGKLGNEILKPIMLMMNN